MSKDLIQLGFMLEREDRDWFTTKCKQENLSAAYILSRYIKHLRAVDALDPFGINSDSNINLNTSYNIDINKVLEAEELKQLVKDTVENYFSNNTVNKVLEKKVNTSINNALTIPTQENLEHIISNSINDMLTPLSSRVALLEQETYSANLESIINDSINTMLTPLSFRVDELFQSLESIVNNNINIMLEPLRDRLDNLKADIEEVIDTVIDSKLDEKLKENPDLYQQELSADVNSPEEDLAVGASWKEFGEVLEFIEIEGQNEPETPLTIETAATTVVLLPAVAVVSQEKDLLQVQEDDEAVPTEVKDVSLTETMTKAEMARILKVSASSVSNWVRNGKWSKFPTDWEWHPIREHFERAVTFAAPDNSP